MSIDADHSDIVKFPKFDHDGLVKALDVLRGFAYEAIPVIENRFRQRSIEASSTTRPGFAASQTISRTGLGTEMRIGRQNVEGEFDTRK